MIHSILSLFRATKILHSGILVGSLLLLSILPVISQETTPEPEPPPIDTPIPIDTEPPPPIETEPPPPTNTELPPPTEPPPPTEEPLTPTLTEAATNTPDLEPPPLEVTAELPSLTPSLLPAERETATPSPTAALPALPLIAYDDFETFQPRAWAFDVMQSRTRTSAGWAIHLNSTNNPLMLAQGNIADVVLQTEVVFNAGAVTLMVRRSAAGNYAVTVDPSGQVTLYRHSQVVGSTAVRALASEQHYNLQLSAISGQVAVGIDGLEVLSVTDPSPLPSGGVLIFSPLEVFVHTLTVYGLTTPAPQVAPPFTGERSTIPQELSQIQSTTNGRIVFSSGDFSGQDIYIMDSDGSNVTQLTNTSGVYNLSPALSPDGTWVVYRSDLGGNMDLYIYDLLTSNISQLTATSGSESDPDWSPTGSQIVFDEAGDIKIITVSGGAVQNLGPGEYSYGPKWSPDGSKIAFLSDLIPDTTFLFELHTMTTSGTNITTLTSGGAGDHAWSPNGNEIVYYSTPHSGLRVITSGGAFVRQLTTGTGDGSPSWSPDGNQIAFSRSGDVYTIASTGGTPANITNSGAFDREPHWGNEALICPGGSGFTLLSCPTPTPTHTPTPTATPTPIPIPTDCGVITTTSGAILRSSPSTEATPIGVIRSGVPWKQFTPVEQAIVGSDTWYLIDYNSYGSQPYTYNSIIYDGTRGWIRSDLVNITNCTSGGAIIPIGSGQTINVDLSRSGQTLPVATGAVATGPDPVDIWSPLGQCPPGTTTGWTSDDIRRRCAYENYIRLWHDTTINGLTLGKIASISILHELNTEFPNIVTRTINGFNDLRTPEKHLVEAGARNFADACIRRGAPSGSNIACNVQGIIEWAETLSPWKNRSDASISSMLQIGGTSYTDYNSKIIPIVFGNSSWASGATSSHPSTWGNYEHILSDGTPVSDAIYPMLETEFTRDPRLTDQIDFINENPRELAVYPGQAALISGQVFHAKAIYRSATDPNDPCEYSFTTTVISPSGLGTLGICG